MASSSGEPAPRATIRSALQRDIRRCERNVCFIRWSRIAVFNKILAALAGKSGKPDQLMIDATHLKAHRTAASLLKKGLFADVSAAPRVA